MNIKYKKSIQIRNNRKNWKQGGIKFKKNLSHLKKIIRIFQQLKRAPSTGILLYI
jgi:hypothetical protein